MLKSCARAPANIALIKYMGKRGDNLPENPSLSLTLEGLCSIAELSFDPQGTPGVRWIPELPQPTEALTRLEVPKLPREGQARVMNFLRKVLGLAPALLKEYGLEPLMASGEPCVELRTANTFPASSGIASSASSFAAVTLAGVGALAADPRAFRAALARPELRRALARISRTGSGSSCRSFEGPWVSWEGESSAIYERARLPDLTNFVLLVSTEPKGVASSVAHERVRSSPLWAGRPERARQRYQDLRTALERGDLPGVARLAWTEAWEMHSLFHTASEPFTYWEPGTIEALHFLAAHLRDERPPIVTMDAGPNLHVLVETDQASRWRELLAAKFGAGKLLEDRQGLGADWQSVSGAPHGGRAGSSRGGV